ncbi:MAG: DUF3574 domain-containing protein [Thermosynechococcaceae cyanobacterium]
MKNKFTATLMQNAILVGFAVVGLSTVHAPPNPQMVALAKQPSVVQGTETNLRQLCNNVPSSDFFARTELFFGLSKPDGSEVTEAEFQHFLNREVTPRFPDGLTLLSGRGQFKNSKGLIVKEPSKLLILLYPIAQSSDSSQKVEQVRKAYKKAFQQESVLRTDETSCVSF